MHIILFDIENTIENIINYILQFLFAHKNNYFIKYKYKKEQYRDFNFDVVKILFICIDDYNNKLKKIEVISDSKLITK